MVNVIGPEAFRESVGHQRSASSRLTPPTIVMFGRPNDPRLHRAVSAGVRGLMLVGDPAEDLRRAIVAVALGGAWITPRLAPRILEHASSLVPSLIEAPFGRLTRREEETVRLVVAGLSNAEIATAHRVTESAVKFQVSSLLRKFGCSRRGQLAAALNGMSGSDRGSVA
jgi:DNA-binding NarL/FixJ family response regulator